MPDVRTQFTFYDSFFRSVSRIRKAADRASAYDAICSYALYGTEPDMDKLPDAAAIAFEVARPNLDASRRKAKSGKAGGMAKQIEETPKQTEAKPKQIEARPKQEKEQEKEQEQDKDKEQMLPPLPPSPGGTGFGEELQAAFDAWVAYKGEKRQAYKPVGLQSLVTEIRHNAEAYGEAAVAALIRECMASNWQGIIFDRLRKQNQTKREVPSGSAGQTPLGDLEQEAVRRMLGEG